MTDQRSKVVQNPYKTPTKPKKNVFIWQIYSILKDTVMGPIAIN